MPCIPIKDGILCIGNAPLTIEYHNKIYSFEWTAASGWCPVNLDGSGRLSPVPKGAWDAFLESPGAINYKKCAFAKALQNERGGAR